jgi:glycosyltransferase involved in cell wall biosynthesis
MRILHIHQDYPDEFPYPFTMATPNLIENCKKVDGSIAHSVLSINRTSNPLRVSVRPFKDGISVRYWAIPLPYLYNLTMRLNSNFLSKAIKDIDFTVIHGHKLTCEGFFAYLLAKKFKVPYIISVRGGSDHNNLKRFSVHKDIFKHIHDNASYIFFVSAWTKNIISKLSNIKRPGGKLLPNICKINTDRTSVKTLSKKNKYLIAINFHQYERKGIIQTIQAIAQLKDKNIKVSLDIYGDGNDTAKKIIENEIQEHKLNKQIELKGRLKQELLYEKMSDYKGFIMPSIKETFGMVYIEAISAGCPIIYLRNTGIDGYFEDYEVGVGIDNQHPETIAKAISILEENRDIHIENLNKLYKDKYLNNFSGETVAKNYLQEVKHVMNNLNG